MSYKDLANAIVVQAYHDYVHGRLTKNGFLSFTMSDWFLLLTRGCIAPAAFIKQGERVRNDIVSRGITDRAGP